MQMLLLILWFIAKYNMKILGNFSYLPLNANFHSYSPICWFNVNLT